MHVHGTSKAFADSVFDLERLGLAIRADLPAAGAEP